MSSPPNPLDKYQSYSYHHFIIAANNTEVLRQIESHEISFSSLSRLKHGETIPGGDGSVVMIVNSAVDSKFYIETLSYSAVYVSIADSTAKLTQTTEVDMVVKETGGANFINFLRDVSDTHLKTSYNSVCFLLKTFFVGHEADGSTTTYPTEPITLVLTNMDSSFDYSGGVHQMKFHGMSNGAPLQNDQMHYVDRNLNLVTSENSLLLKDLISDLEKKLNTRLDEQWKLVQKSSGGNGRKVRYKFTMPKDWENYKVKSTSKDNYIERLFEKEKQKVEKDSDAKKNESQQSKPGIESDRFKTNMNTSVNTTVTQILSEIFKHCDEIQAAFVGNAKANASTVNLPKLHQVVASITSDKEELVVHFDILNYYLPRLPTKDQEQVIKKVTEANRDAINAATFDKYGITFDYIFTGANSDILALDIKANHTNMILIGNQTGIQKATGNMTSTNDSVQQAADDQNKVKVEGKEAETILPMRKYDAVFLSSAPADAQRGFIYAAPDSAELRTKYINALALLAASTSTNMHVVVRGNPVFMNQVIRPLFPHNDVDYEAKLRAVEAEAFEKATKKEGDFDPIKSATYMGVASSHIPQYVKINIKTPTYNEAGEVTGFEDFWYRGRYRVTSIKNNFIGGQFTQELYLLPYDAQGST
jgi:hypothetical protein